MSKINEIIEAILTLDADMLSEAEVFIGVNKETGEILGAGLTEKMAYACAMSLYTADMPIKQANECEANASHFVSLKQVPLW